MDLARDRAMSTRRRAVDAMERGFLSEAEITACEIILRLTDKIKGRDFVGSSQPLETD